MKLQIIEELGAVEKEYGNLNEKDVLKIIAWAQKLNLYCLHSVDTIEDAYFNDLQCKTIKEEVAVLEQESDIDTNILNLIKNAADFVSQEGYTYLRFRNP